MLQSVGDKYITELTKPEPATIIVSLDWTESISHPDEHVRASTCRLSAAHSAPTRST